MTVLILYFLKKIKLSSSLFSDQLNNFKNSPNFLLHRYIAFVSFYIRMAFISFHIILTYKRVYIYLYMEKVNTTLRWKMSYIRNLFNYYDKQDLRKTFLLLFILRYIVHCFILYFMYITYILIYNLSCGFLYLLYKVYVSISRFLFNRKSFSCFIDKYM